MIVVDVPQRSPEWFQARLGRLTASDAKHALNFLKGGNESAARRDLRMRLVCERLTGQSQADDYTNADMARGVELEPEARAAYEAEAGVLVESVGFVQHDTLMAGGSPDGMVNGWEGLIEIKCPRPANHVRLLREGGIPYEHKPQLAHLLWLTGARWIDFVSYCPQLPERMRLYVARMCPSVEESASVNLAEHERYVTRFLQEVDVDVASLQGWGVLKETA